MNPSSRATVHVGDDLDYRHVARGDVVTMQHRDDTVYFIFDGEELVRLDPTTRLPPLFNVPEEFPPKYWSDALSGEFWQTMTPRQRSVPAKPLRIDNITDDNVYRYVDLPDRTFYLVVPFVTNGTVYYYTTFGFNVDDTDDEDDEDVELDLYLSYDRIGVSSTLHTLGTDPGMAFLSWTDRDVIPGIDPDLLLVGW